AFDDTMKPLIAGKEGVESLKDYIALTKFMPKDILGWATPQAYPFFAGGNAFSIMTYPSIAIAAEHPEKSKIAGKNKYCLVPGYVVNGKLVRRSLQGFGNLLYVSNYSKHPEAAYWLAQYLTSKEVSARPGSRTDLRLGSIHEVASHRPACDQGADEGDARGPSEERTGDGADDPHPGRGGVQRRPRPARPGGVARQAHARGRAQSYGGGLGEDHQ